MAEEKTVKEKIKENKFNLEEMIRAGVHFGHAKSKLHPKMKPYVFGIRKTVHVINLEETVKKLEAALGFIKELMINDKTILFVGTKIQHRQLIKDLANEFNFPYVSERWLGGCLTNFNVMRERVSYFQKLRETVDSDEFDKYPKKEQSKMRRELRNLETKFAGVEKMENLPDVIFVSDIKKDKIALREAKKKNMPIIAIVDTNVDPTPVDWPIPASDDATSSAKYILEKIREAILEVKSK